MMLGCADGLTFEKDLGREHLDGCVSVGQGVDRGVVEDLGWVFLLNAVLLEGCSSRVSCLSHR